MEVYIEYLNEGAWDNDPEGYAEYLREKEDEEEDKKWKFEQAEKKRKKKEAAEKLLEGGRIRVHHYWVDDDWVKDKFGGRTKVKVKRPGSFDVPIGTSDEDIQSILRRKDVKLDHTESIK